MLIVFQLEVIFSTKTDVSHEDVLCKWLTFCIFRLCFCFEGCIFAIQNIFSGGQIVMPDYKSLIVITSGPTLS